MTLHSYLRHSWGTIPSSHDCPIWTATFCPKPKFISFKHWAKPPPGQWTLSQGPIRWNVQAQIENIWVLQSFQEVFSNHWAKHTRMHKYICSANRRILVYYIFLSLPSMVGTHSSISWDGYCVLLAVIILPKVCLFFPSRCFVDIPKLDMLSVWSNTA